MQLNFDLVQHYDPGKPGIGITVRLYGLARVVDVVAKLDTGSTYCLFERLLGEDLGLDVEAGEPQTIGAVTGSFLAYGHFITFSVDELYFEGMVYFAKDYTFNRNVLGRVGFLNRVLLGLNDYAGRLYLSREMGDK